MLIVGQCGDVFDYFHITNSMTACQKRITVVAVMTLPFKG
uniref:Uncharacterized protein n=1 Tax=Anguilla anguilla TaxID=7936 RepID=A0A0E9X1M2_ANGAN